MIHIHHYSERKYHSFPAHKQQSIVIEMLSAIENNLTNREMVDALIEHLQECLFWSGQQYPGLVVTDDFAAVKSLSPHLSVHAILHLITPVLNKHQQNRSEMDCNVTRYDGKCRQLDLQRRNSLTVYAVLDNLRSAYNVGAIFRIAECFGFTSLYLCGITSTPENNKVKMTAMGTEKLVPWQYFRKTSDAVSSLRQQNIRVVALETAENSVALNEFTADASLALVLGNEALGIDPDILAQADITISIPIFGNKNSLNVSSAFAIAAYGITQRKDPI